MKKFPKIAVLIVGILAGAAIAGLGFKVVYKMYRNAQTPQRFDARNAIAKLKGPTIQKDLKIFVASSTDRFFLDGQTLVPPQLSNAISLSASRQEYESAQIIIYPLKKNLQGVVVGFSDLIDPATNARIDKINLTSRFVGFVPTRKPYYPVKFVGKWSDPLIPQEKSDVALGETQPFWVTVYVPERTPAGHYEGQVTVQADDMPAQVIAFKLRVYDFTLPKESHLKTAFDFYGHITKMRYPQGEKESEAAWQARVNDVNDKFIIEMLKYRMNPILNIDPTSQSDLGRVDHYRVYGLNNFSIGKKGGTFNNNWPTDEESINSLEGLYRTYAELLHLNRMFEFTYIYTWDEGPIGKPVVAKITAMIHRAFPKLKNMVCYHGFWDPDKNPEWGKDIDIWTFSINEFNETAMRKLQKIGMEIWMYVSGPAGMGEPNLVIDEDSIDYRIHPWLCWKYDITGFLYWCVNWWVVSDPFQSAVNTKWKQNGNGLLFYPGTEGPWASIRAEVFRDGMEDYEYIQMLIKKIKEMKILKIDQKYAKEIDDSIKVMTVDPTIAKSMTQFTKDGAVLTARRNAIARKIEEFNEIIIKERPLPPVVAPTPVNNAEPSK